MGLTEDELPDIVERWREANSKIRDLWYAMDAAAVQVIQCGGTARVRNVVFAREYDVVQGVSCMTITRPPGASCTISIRLWAQISGVAHLSRIRAGTRKRKSGKVLKLTGASWLKTVCRP